MHQQHDEVMPASYYPRICAYIMAHVISSITIHAGGGKMRVS